MHLLPRRPLLALLLLGGLAPWTNHAAAQISGTWSGGGGTNGAWSHAGNWVGGTPLGGITATITFGATSGTTIVNQDLATTFTLNRLSITNLNAGGVSSFTLTGGALRFEGDAPTITAFNAGTTTQTINNRLVIGSPQGLLITSQGTGNPSFIINGGFCPAETTQWA